MKVLYVITSLGAGGAERSLAEMLPVLRENGVEPVVLSLYARVEGFEQEVRDAGFETRVVRGRHLASRVLEARALLRAERPAIVHTTLFDADLVGRLAAARAEVAVVTSLVNTSYDEVRLHDPNVPAWKLRAVQAVEGWTARHLTDHFHAVSQAVKDSAVRALRIPAEQVTVIPRGRDTRRLGAPGEERRRRARVTLGLAPDDLVLVTVGRQEFQKGQRFLLEAVETLSDRHLRLLVLLAGREGHESANLRVLAARPALRGRVRLLGFREDIPEILAAGDLFVFPSLYEGLGGAVVEAMALGLPVIVSDLPALREVVEEGGNALLVPPEDVQALAGAIDSLLGDPARRQSFGARSRVLFREAFSLERAAKQMLDLYRRVAPRVA